MEGQWVQGIWGLSKLDLKILIYQIAKNPERRSLVCREAYVKLRVSPFS